MPSICGSIVDLFEWFYPTCEFGYSHSTISMDLFCNMKTNTLIFLAFSCRVSFHQLNNSVLPFFTLPSSSPPLLLSCRQSSLWAAFQTPVPGWWLCVWLLITSLQQDESTANVTAAIVSRAARGHSAPSFSLLTAVQSPFQISSHRRNLCFW